MKSILYFIIGILLIGFFGYYFYFVKSDRVDDSNFLYTCKLESENKIKVELATAASYISNYKSVLVSDTIFIEIYTTSVANIFNSSRDIQLKLPLFEQVKFVKICEKSYNIDSLFECKTESINQAIEGVTKVIE